MCYQKIFTSPKIILSVVIVYYNTIIVLTKVLHMFSVHVVWRLILKSKLYDKGCFGKLNKTWGLNEPNIQLREVDLYDLQKLSMQEWYYKRMQRNGHEDMIII